MAAKEVVPPAGTASRAKQSEKTRQEKQGVEEKEKERETGEYSRAVRPKSRTKPGAEGNARPTASSSKDVVQEDDEEPEQQEQEEQQEQQENQATDAELVEVVNAGLEYLHDSQKKIDRYRAQRIKEDERLEEMVLISGNLVRGIKSVIRRLGLPREEEEAVLGPFERHLERKRDEPVVEEAVREEDAQGQDEAEPEHEPGPEPEPEPEELAEETPSNSQWRHGKDSETRLREAGLVNGADNRGERRSRRDEGRREGEAYSNARSNTQGSGGGSRTPGRRTRTGGDGAPGGSDDEGSSDGDGGSHRDRREADPLPRRRARRGESRERVTDTRRVDWDTPNVNRAPAGVAQSISLAQPYSAALPTVRNNAHAILQILERVLYTDVDDIPVVNKHFKPQPPPVYNGEDNVNIFEDWVQGASRFY